MYSAIPFGMHRAKAFPERCYRAGNERIRESYGLPREECRDPGRYPVVVEEILGIRS